MDDFLKKVDEVICSVQTEKNAEEKEMERVWDLFIALCQKAAKFRVSLVIVDKKEKEALKITADGKIALSTNERPIIGKWKWTSLPVSIEEVKKLWFSNREGIFYCVLMSALKNEADVEIEIE